MTLLLLGAIAVLAVVQAACLFLIWREGTQVARTLDDMAEQVGRSLTPVQADLGRAARNFAGVTDLAAREARRVDELLAELAARLGSLRQFLDQVVLPLGASLGTVGTVLRLARRFSRRLPRRP